MSINEQASFTDNAPSGMEKRLIWAVLCCLVVLSVLAWLQGHRKMVAISWLAFMAMASVIPWGLHAGRNKSVPNLVMAYGLCSGAMMSSAVIFLIPQAVGNASLYGSIGIAAGVVTGIVIHGLNKRASQPFGSTDPLVIELSIHALAAGLVTGLVYTAMPGLSLLLGVSIISHKAPAGYAVARRLATRKRDVWVILIPASGIGLTGLAVSLMQVPSNALANALIFGFATGLFFHIALDFLPLGPHNHAHISSSASRSSSRLRAALSTLTGAVLVMVLWLLTM